MILPHQFPEDNNLESYIPLFESIGFSQYLFKVAFSHTNIQPDYRKLFQMCDRVSKTFHPEIDFMSSFQLLSLAGDEFIGFAIERYGGPDNRGLNLLHYAGIVGSVAFIKAVLALALEFKLTQDNYGFNVLLCAGKSGVVDAIQFVLERCPELENSSSRQGSNLLHCVGQSGSLPAIQFVLARYPHLKESVTISKRNVLHCIAWSASIEAMEFGLNEWPGFINAVDEDRSNIFHYAVMSRSAEFVRYLLVTYPALCASLWVKDGLDRGPDDYARIYKAEKMPSAILRELFQEVFICFIEKKKLEDWMPKFLEAFKFKKEEMFESICGFPVEKMRLALKLAITPNYAIYSIYNLMAEPRGRHATSINRGMLKKCKEKLLEIDPLYTDLRLFSGSREALNLKVDKINKHYEIIHRELFKL